MALVLAGCGGGGGGSSGTGGPSGGGSGGGTGPVYTGASTPATIAPRADSAGRIADAIVLTTTLARTYGDEFTPFGPQSGRYTRSVAGPQGGSASVDGDFASDGTGTETTTFSAFGSDGAVFDGALRIRVLVSPGTSPGRRRVEFSNFRVRTASPAQQLAIGGTVERAEDASAPGQVLTRTLTADLVLADGVRGTQIQTRGLVVRSVQPTPSGASSVSGRLFVSSAGYVDLSTDAPIDFADDDVPTRGGGILATGEASRLRLSHVGSQVAAIELASGATTTPTLAAAVSPGSSFEDQLANTSTSVPIAAAGPTFPLAAGTPQRLDGRTSGFNRRAFVSFAWRIASAPPGSAATLEQPNSPTPTLTTDREGDYIVTLTTTEGTNVSRDALVLQMPLGILPTQAPDPRYVAYLGPDRSGVRNAVLSVSLGRSWWPVSAPPSVYAGITDPTGAVVAQQTSGVDAFLPEADALLPGFYALGLLLNDPVSGSASQQFVAIDVPLLYTRRAQLVVPGPISEAVAADLDAVGGADLVVASPSFGADRVVVVRSTASGRFAEPQSIPVGPTRGLAVADFDGDGRPDIAAGGRPATLIPQLANGSFGASIPLAAPTDGACQSQLSLGAAAGDFDGDGRKDLVVATDCGVYYQYLQGGSGLLAPTAIAVGASYPDPRRIIAADVTGDGVTDLVALIGAGSGNPTFVRTYPGGRGGLGAPVDVVVPNTLGTAGPLGFTVGDFDGDGKVDVVAVNPEGIYLFPQRNGTLALPLRLADADVPLDEVHVRDIDRDGRADLVVATLSSRQPARVLYQAPDGSLRAPAPFPAPGNAPFHELVFADFDGDGREDLFSDFFQLRLRLERTGD